MPNDSVAAFNNYCARVGAKKTKHPRKFIVDGEEDSLYGRIKLNLATIKCSADGQITVSVRRGEDERLFLPTDDEREAVRQEITSLGESLLHTTIASDVHLDDLRKKTGGDTLFIYRSSQGILMVQQRVYFDGDHTDKHDLPWSFWSDGQWRNCESDGLLPLFGLDQIAKGGPIMIHEGAKAADHWQKRIIANDFHDHPWGEDLRHFVHLGWPGGAPNPHRVDWSPIKNLPPSRLVILVCDNDQVGVNACPSISRTLMRPLSMIRFSNEFPVSFDLADPWPERKNWKINGQYRGPVFGDGLQSATWATEPRPRKDNKGAQGYRIRSQFAAEWCYITNPSCFVRQPMIPGEILNEDGFNNVVAPFSDVDNTARLMIKSLYSQVREIHYSPADQPGASGKGRLSSFNTFYPSLIKSKKGDVQPFLDFMDYLIPVAKDRHELMRWCATLIASIETRMRYGVLLISGQQGVGKGTLGATILANLVGRHNTSFPSETMLIDSKFNAWAAHKRLIVVHEIYAGHSRKGYDHTKSLITDLDLTVNKKFIDEYTIQNWCHVFACSNSLSAIHLDDVDRRWFLPEVAEGLRTTDYWMNLYQWLDGGGLEIIANWAKWFIGEHGAVRTADHAPHSSSKDSAIRESMTDGQRIAMDIAMEMIRRAQDQQQVVVAIEEVRAKIAHRRGMTRSEQFTEKSTVILRTMMSIGALYTARDNGQLVRYSIDQGNGVMVKTYVIANFPIRSEMGWSYLKQFYVSVEQLERL